MENPEIEKSLASIPLVHCNSYRGPITKNLGFSGYFSSEFATSRVVSDTNRASQKDKKDFLPFLHERDGMNRLLTNRSKFDPQQAATLEDSLNPTFYYKSSRFNKFKLILGQAERTKNSLGKLLSFRDGESEEPNFLEKDKIKRTNRLLVLNKNTSAKIDSWLQLEQNMPLTEQSEDNIEEIELLKQADETDLRPSNKNQSIACSLSKCISDIRANKKDQTFVLGNTILSPKLSNPSNNTDTTKHSKQAKSLSGLNKNIFAPKNDFCNYYQKLDEDIRKINNSSYNLRRKAHSSVSNLNAIMKKFEEDKNALLLEDLYILSTPPKLSQRTPRMEWFTTFNSPRENANGLLNLETQPTTSGIIKTPGAAGKKTPLKKKVIIKSSIVKKYQPLHIQV